MYLYKCNERFPERKRVGGRAFAYGEGMAFKLNQI